MFLMLKVETSCPGWDSRQFWREHALQHEPLSHVVIFPTPSPEVHSIPIHLLKLFTREYGYATKEVLDTPGMFCCATGAGVHFEQNHATEY